MIKLNIRLTMFILSIVSLLPAQDTIQKEIELRKHYFEGYVYLISQDALGTKDAYSVATSLNIIGEFVLLGKTNKQRSSHFDYWIYTTEPSNPEESVPDMAEKAGLLWNTNDLGSNIFMSGIGVMAFRQQLFEDKLSLRIGKLFPGVYYQSNYYAPNNSETHMNNMLTGNPVSSWFGSLGLGAMAEYESNKWFFGKLGVHDANANKEIDFKTISDGKFLYISELGIKGSNAKKEYRFSILYSYVNELPGLSAEHGFSLGGVYNFGENSNWGVYGRYSFRNGGNGNTEPDKANENVLASGGYLGVSRKTPWKLDKAEIGGAYFVGRPSVHQIDLGKQTQYGIETYFKWSFQELLHAAFDFQLVNTGNRLEPIIGLRVKAGWNTLF